MYDTGAVHANKPLPEAYLDRLQTLVADCHQHVTGISEVLDRALGVEPESANKVTAVPAGLLERIEDNMRGLHERLEVAVSRLRTVA